MKIGIVGAGNVGQQLGLGFAGQGHKVMIGTRNTLKLGAWQKHAGSAARVGSFEDAARFGKIIFLCTLWSGTENAINLAGVNNFRGKIVIDVTNPIDFSEGNPPKLKSSPGNSGGEKVQHWLPDSKVVKAFNTINAFKMCNPKFEEGKPDLFIAGNSEKAKRAVIDIAKSFGWENVYDIGEMDKSYLLEALAELWIVYGFKYNHWSHVFKMLRK